MESLIRDHVVTHLDSSQLLSVQQHGFRTGHSCTTNLLAALDRWTEALDKGNNVDAVYLDFAKAFDSVPHKRLLLKLKGYGIDKNTLHWIEGFLSHRRQRVCINGMASSWAPVKSGIPQGSVLGPVLFIVFINDLPEVVKSTSLIFADDTKIFNNADSEDSIAMLQKDINHLTEWANTWQLRFNAAKCKVLHLGRSNQEHIYKIDKDSSSQIPLEKTSLEK